MKNKPSIAFIIKNSNELFIEHPGATSGGVTVVAQNLYKTLTKELNYDVDIYTFTKPDEKFHATKYIEIDKQQYEAKKLTEYLDKQNYDYIITINPDDIYRGKLLQTHSLLYRLENYPFIINMLKSIFLNSKIRSTHRQYENVTAKDTFIAVSYKIKHDYSYNFGIPLTQIKVAYPGCKQIYDKIPVIEQKGIPTFGIIANSAINKGGHLFLLACGFAKLISKLNFKIIMIAPKYNKDIILKSLVKLFQLNIKILPKQNDMEYFYKSIDYLALPSKNEAFGLVVLEAMAYCKPVLVSNTAGSAEITNSQNGFIFNRKSFFNLVKNIIDMTNIYHNDFNHYKNLASNAYKISLYFTWENFCNAIVSNT